MGRLNASTKGKCLRLGSKLGGVGGGPGQAEPDFSSQRETVSTETLIRVGQP